MRVKERDRDVGEKETGGKATIKYVRKHRSAIITQISYILHKQKKRFMQLEVQFWLGQL